MQDKKALAIKIICVILSIAIAVAVILAIYFENKHEAEKVAIQQEIIDEAEPYEREVRELKNRLKYLEENISYSSEEAEFMIGYIVTDSSDLDYIAKKAETYGFLPVIVLDCTLDMTTIADILENVSDSWEIMLYASSFSEDVNRQVVTVLDYMQIISKSHTGVFYLRNDYRTDENVQLLADDGFIGYTYYHSDSPTVGQSSDGMVYFDYSYLSSSQTTVVSRLALAYDSKASIIITFDMSNINSGLVSDVYVTSLFDIIVAYTVYDDCTFSTVAEVVEELSSINTIEAENLANYNEQSVIINARIAELQEIISSIYDKLD